jgi:hypothetical protein
MGWHTAPTISADYLGTPAAPVAIPAAYAAGAAIDTGAGGDQKWIAVLSKITTLGSATTFRLKYEVSVDGSNFMPLKTEAVAAGVGTLSTYETEIAAVLNDGITMRLELGGYRYWRVSWKVDTVTGSPLGYVQYALSGGPI